MKKKPQMIRQGDVLLILVSEVDESQLSPAPKDVRGIVLAEGETSGHYHGVVGKGRYRLFNFRDSTQRMLQVGSRGAELRVVGGGAGGVDRHTPVSLAPGKYLVRVQRSWSSENASRQVQD